MKRSEDVDLIDVLEILAGKYKKPTMSDLARGMISIEPLPPGGSPIYISCDKCKKLLGVDTIHPPEECSVMEVLESNES